MDTVRVETASPEFDRYLDWLKYQALAERIWARRGFYQASGAFGFRDQLQDSVNLNLDGPGASPASRSSCTPLSSSSKGTWSTGSTDSRTAGTGFVARTHASDNLCCGWPGAWSNTSARPGDSSLLDERTPYLESELPFPPLPSGKHGMGFDPLRSSREDTVYRHCLKAIDLVLGRRMGAHGLPLIGTGDWNDGLDEIGSQGRGESVWLGFFLYYILERMAPIVGREEGDARQDHYLGKLRELGEALESTWRDDRYLRAIHDDGTEIGVKGSGVWEIDALTAAWAVMAGINPGRGRIVFETALSVLEKDTTILLGWPPLREPTPSPTSAGVPTTPKGSARTACIATASSGSSAPRGSWPTGPRPKADRTTPAITGRPLTGSGGRSRPCPTSSPTRSRPTAASPTSRRPTW